MWHKKVFRSANLTKVTKMRVFRTMVMSILLYGAETWTITQRDVRKLRTFHMKCLRNILGVTRWDKIRKESILCSVNEVPIEEQLKHLRLQWLGHVMRMDSCRVQRQLLCSKLTEKVRPRGGTPLRWIDLITKYLVGIQDWREVVHNQSQWREAIRPALHPHEDKEQNGMEWNGVCGGGCVVCMCVCVVCMCVCVWCACVCGVHMCGCMCVHTCVCWKAYCVVYTCAGFVSLTSWFPVYISYFTFLCFFPLFSYPPTILHPLQAVTKFYHPLLLFDVGG